MSCNSNRHASSVNYRITLSANFVSIAVAFLQPWSLVDWQVGRFFYFVSLDWILLFLWLSLLHLSLFSPLSLSLSLSYSQSLTRTRLSHPHTYISLSLSLPHTHSLTVIQVQGRQNENTQNQSHGTMMTIFGSKNIFSIVDKSFGAKNQGSSSSSFRNCFECWIVTGKHPLKFVGLNNN